MGKHDSAQITFIISLHQSLYYVYYSVWIVRNKEVDVCQLGCLTKKTIWRTTTWHLRFHFSNLYRCLPVQYELLCHNFSTCFIYFKWKAENTIIQRKEIYAQQPISFGVNFWLHMTECCIKSCALPSASLEAPVNWIQYLALSEAEFKISISSISLQSPYKSIDIPVRSECIGIAATSGILVNLLTFKTHTEIILPIFSALSTQTNTKTFKYIHSFPLEKSSWNVQGNLSGAQFAVI